MRMLIIAAAIVATPVSAADQFDLVCNGGVKWKPSARAEPISAHYRVDLAAGVWCRDICKTAQKIAAVEPSRIIFHMHDRQFERDERSYETVDRNSGDWKDYSSGTDALGLFMEVTGKCETAPFTGLPSTKF